MKTSPLVLLTVILSLVLSGCTSSPTRSSPPAASALQTESADTTPESVERDYIYQLLAYAIVNKDWQTMPAKTEGSRGHNIGCVLVDSSGGVVDWARNCNGLLKNGTQHGETRVMLHFQGSKQLYDLKGYTIYTTLEPCAMCSGMMIQQKMSRTVYGQTDLDFGKAIERLQYAGGPYPAYPRSMEIKSEPAQNDLRQRIDEAFQAHVAKTGSKDVTAWLITEEAHKLYQEATDRLLQYVVKSSKNQPALNEARAMYGAATPEQKP